MKDAQHCLNVDNAAITPVKLDLEIFLGEIHSIQRVRLRDLLNFRVT